MYFAPRKYHKNEQNRVLDKRSEIFPRNLGEKKIILLFGMLFVRSDFLFFFFFTRNAKDSTTHYKIHITTL